MAAATIRTVLLIAGMKGNGCREIVADALKSATGVKEVHVALIRSCAEVVHEPSCTAAELSAAIVHAGYLAVVEQKAQST